VGGVILFARNFESPRSSRAHAEFALCAAEPLIAVDHEGGRCSASRRALPVSADAPARERWDADPAGPDPGGGDGYVVAVELRTHGVDFSFAPVLDVDFGSSSVIGDPLSRRSPP